MKWPQDYCSVQRCGKVAKIKSKPIQVYEDNQLETTIDEYPSIQQLYNDVTQNDIGKWNLIKNCNDSRLVWQNIHFKGEIKSEQDDNIDTENFFKINLGTNYKEEFFDDLKQM